MLPRLLTDHPETVNETYGQHFRSALAFSRAMFVGGLACAIHAFLPFLFVNSGSRVIGQLNERMIVARRRHDSSPN